MADTLLPIALPPGFRNTGTVYQSKGRWHSGNLARFFNGTIQSWGGWESRTITGATMAGVPRAMVSWRRNDATQVMVIGTTRGLYAVVSGVAYDITPAAVASNVTARVWQLDVFGSYLVAVDLTAPSTGGRAYYWTGDTAAVAANLDPFSTGAVPLTPLSTVTTPERFLVMLGALYTGAGWSATGIVPVSRVVTWATQEGGFTGSEWVPAATNTAGDFTLTTDGALVCGKRSRGSTLLWTTTDLWTMTYIGGTLVYRFDQAGNKCGIISSRAAIVTDAAAYWMGLHGFYKYDGFVQPIPCEVHDYVFGSLNRTYAHYIWAVENAPFGEVTWFYPSAAATEVDRYVTYSYRENHWTFGELERTAGMTMEAGVTPFPVMTTAARIIYNHEVANGQRGNADAAYLESGPFESGNGDRVLSVQRVIPDDQTVGEVNLTLYTTPNPGTAETAHGPYTLSAETDVRIRARQVRAKLTEVQSVSAVAADEFDPVTDATYYESVAWSPELGLFAAVTTQNAGELISTSPDGQAWTDRGTPATDPLLRRVIWVNDAVAEVSLFIAVGDDRSGGAPLNAAVSSANGVTWTQRTTFGTGATQWHCVAWSSTQGKALAASVGSAEIMSTTNGTSWASVTPTGMPANGFSDLIWYPPGAVWIGLADATSTIYSSPTGTTWTAVSGFPSTVGSLSRITYVSDLGKLYVLASGGGITYVVISEDGLTWETVQMTAAFASDPSGPIVWMAAARALVWCTYDVTPDGDLYYSLDEGATWTNVALGVTGGIDFAWAPELNRGVLVNGASGTASTMVTISPTVTDWRVGTVRLGVREGERRG